MPDEIDLEELGVDIDKEQLMMLKKCFDTFDREKKGFINADMVQTILSMMGLQFDTKELRAIIQEVDVDGSGQIEFNEFVLLSSKFMADEDSGVMEQELREAFRLYDKQGQGFITTGVLREIIHELDPKLSEDELDEMIGEIDTDGSGTVDFDEFMEMMTGE
ncbi:unnamed protein product [Cyprideis torosa]|uniref:Uncharacterized protein n=1 Tax=Cyprideis torosa TaxID=163714 RepID=A0A7R8W3X3_9CRUS|nr:unnamed protein product [Cyprideis torosa]CAG0883488.1 unnamed protein product [Cyprideis torosa]